MALWTFGIVNTLLCLFSQHFQTTILHFLVPSSFAQAPCGQYLAFFSAPPISCVFVHRYFVPDLPFPLLQLPKNPDGHMAFIDSLKRYSDIPVLFSVLLGFLFGTFDIRLSEALTPWLQPTSWQGLVAQVCGLQVVHGGAYPCSSQVCN